MGLSFEELVTMTDYGFVCHECGRKFRGINARIGEEMCPECGSIDIARIAPATSAARAAPTAPPESATPAASTAPSEPAARAVPTAPSEPAASGQRSAVIDEV
jgi:predicted  nucleic acid-binding Zn-ribbon protein